VRRRRSGPCLGVVFAATQDADCRKLLAAITASAERLRLHKRFDMPGIRPTGHYVRQMQRIGVLPQALKRKEAIDVDATDQADRQSFWHRPPGRRWPPAARGCPPSGLGGGGGIVGIRQRADTATHRLMG
jgi:hypothetical protein